MLTLSNWTALHYIVISIIIFMVQMVQVCVDTEFWELKSNSYHTMYSKHAKYALHKSYINMVELIIP